MDTNGGPTDVRGCVSGTVGGVPASVGLGAEGPRPTDAEGPGATASNTAPDNYMGSPFQPLRLGVDSLYLSYRGKLSEESVDLLSGLKEFAQSAKPGERGQAVLGFGDRPFEVKDKARRLFSFALEDGSYRIDLARPQSSLPMAYCKVSSDCLAAIGPEKAQEELYAVLQSLGEPGAYPTVSRLDIFADFACTAPMNAWTEEAWVTRADRVYRYTEGGEFTGWGVGAGGPLLCRLYNKSIEIKKSGKDYLKDLWRERGWNGSDPVWRLEFQFRHEVLKQFELGGFRAAMDSLKGLWIYAMAYVRLAVPNPKDRNRTRWATHPLWTALGSLDWEGKPGPFYRDYSPTRTPSREFLSRQAFSAATSYMAREGISDFDCGWEQLGLMTYNIQSGKGVGLGASFQTLVDETVHEKARRYNTANNIPEYAREIEDEELAEYARRYERESNGG